MNTWMMVLTVSLVTTTCFLYVLRKRACVHYRYAEHHQWRITIEEFSKLAVYTPHATCESSGRASP